MLTQVAMADIFSDDTFNCRGEISQYEVAELAEDIKEQGLIQPIIVQPWDAEEGYKYRIVIGHRRHLAYKVLGYDEIEAIIREDLDEDRALAINLSENIQRTQLNVYQEAKAVEKFKLKGKTIYQIADLLSVSKGWVQIRFALLKLPYDVQQEAAAGYLTHAQIKDLASITNREELYSIVRNIKNHKQRGEKGSILVKTGKVKFKKTQKKARTIPEIYYMQDLLFDAVGNGLGTRALAWAGGVITNEEFFTTIKEENPAWELPEYD